MCVAYKRLVPEEYEGICKLLQAAKVALQDRDKKLAEAYEQIETGLILLGATAVEDRLGRTVLVLRNRDGVKGGAGPPRVAGASSGWAGSLAALGDSAGVRPG